MFISIGEAYLERKKAKAAGSLPSTSVANTKLEEGQKKTKKKGCC